MQIIRDFEADISCCSGDNYIYSIGTFDGVHLGHRALIDSMKSKKGYKGGIISFVIHPKYDREENWQGVLTCDTHKVKILENLGIDRVILVDFNQIKDYSYKKFLDFLIKYWGLKALIGGRDNAFGKNREGSLDIIKKEYTNKIEVFIEDFKMSDEKSDKVSSSIIREFLLEGKIESANRMLGYRYFIDGVSRKGRGVGRKIGFPTVNVTPICEEKILPKDGVYFVSILIDGVRYFGGCNVGYKPTYDGKNRTIEIYVINVNNDLFYIGEFTSVIVEFIERIRDEKRFDNENELKKHITKDINVIKKLVEAKDYESY